MDGSGMCNYCNYWDARKGIYTDYDRLSSIFEDRLERSRGKFAYDALVGVSGGKDSTYVLYKLVTDYRLNVLAVTFDNGFLTDYAKKNIKTVIEKLGVDHFFIYPNRDVHMMFYKAAFERFGDPCVACAIAGYFNFTRICHEKRIPFFIHGRSPFQMFRNFHENSRDVFISMVNANLEAYSPDKLIHLYTKIDGQLRTWLNRLFDGEEQREKIYNEFFIDPEVLTRDFVPEHLGLFFFLPYDEEHIKKVIETQVGYRRPDDDSPLSHADCKIHDASAYLFRKIHGISMIALEVAVMLRRGLVTPGEAKRIISLDERKFSNPEESIDCLCRSIGRSKEDFYAMADTLKISVTDKFEAH